MIRSRLFWQHFLSYFAVILVTTLVVSYLLSVQIRNYIESGTLEELKDKLSLLEPVLAGGGGPVAATMQSSLQEIAQQARVRFTVLDEGGRVLLESGFRDPGTMENHLDRPEVQWAKQQGFGSARRFSTTLGQTMFYAARPWQFEGTTYFIRAAVPLERLEDSLQGMRNAVLVGAVAGILLGLLLATVLARRITIPVADLTLVADAISRGEYHVRPGALPGNELGTLGRAISTLGERIQTNIARLEKMEKIRSQFTTNISHELKTPLTSAKGYVETLQEGALEDREVASRFLKIIHNNIDRLISLVQDLLRLSAIEADEDKVQVSPVSWNAVIREAAGRMAPALEKKRLTLNLQTDDSFPPVLGENRAMSHILDNLTQNAISYTDPGGSITIRQRWDTESPGDVLLEVQDTGIGISEKDQARIFERFYRVDKARSKDSGGTGLGLAIVKHLAIRINGRLGLRSRPGEGSCFSIALPACDD